MSRRHITTRPAFFALAKVLVLGVSAVTGAPVKITPWGHSDHEDDAEGAALWILYVVSMVLVLLGGAFAGLTIALMGQDSIYLQVTSQDPEEPQRKNAKRVHDLLNRGKHWVLVTLLLSNVIVNETLPVVLDRCFGGGVAAVVGSTVLIVIFGEILPQSICVRYGLQIGGFMSKPVLLLMYLMAPVAWPTAKLLDWLLGEDHGTVYKKSGLKTLVTLHQSLGEVSERLNEDEVTIISAVLDLKRKPVEEVMTPMEDVYVMSEDTVLDEKTIDQILVAGYSRIPIHQTGNPNNFVGMLLVKILITYDPEDCKRVRDFSLATLPETRPETSCLDIINFFQEGKSHMVLISEFPGEDHGILGVVTLEDVIEELIGEEIIDESDVYVDVHKAIRRSHPAPKARYQQQQQRIAKDLIDLDDTAEDGEVPQSTRVVPINGKNETPAQLASSPRTTTLLMRRSSTGQDGQTVHTTVPLKANFDEIRGHLKHLGPSNPASNPKSTKVAAVKIKPGVGPQRRTPSMPTEGITEFPSLTDGVNERTSLLRPHIDGKDGIQALHQSYNSTPLSTKALPDSIQPKLVITPEAEGGDTQTKRTLGSEENNSPTPVSASSVASLTPKDSNSALADRRRSTRGYARSGSITENVIEAGGIRKVVLEATSSGEDGEPSGSRTGLVSPGIGTEDENTEARASNEADDASTASGQGAKKKNRRKKRKGSK